MDLTLATKNHTIKSEMSFNRLCRIFLRIEEQIPSTTTGATKNCTSLKGHNENFHIQNFHQSNKIAFEGLTCLKVARNGTLICFWLVELWVFQGFIGNTEFCSSLQTSIYKSSNCRSGVLAYRLGSQCNASKINFVETHSFETGLWNRK